MSSTSRSGRRVRRGGALAACASLGAQGSTTGRPRGTYQSYWSYSSHSSLIDEEGDNERPSPWVAAEPRGMRLFFVRSKPLDGGVL
jgi:hypothetical protein